MPTCKPKLLIHFPCRGRVWRLFSDATVTVGDLPFVTLTKAGQLWIPKRDTFLAMVRVWSSNQILPGKLGRDSVVTAAILREQIESEQLERANA